MLNLKFKITITPENILRQCCIRFLHRNGSVGFPRPSPGSGWTRAAAKKQWGYISVKCSGIFSSSDLFCGKFTAIASRGRMFEGKEMAGGFQFWE